MKGYFWLITLITVNILACKNESASPFEKEMPEFTTDTSIEDGTGNELLEERLTTFFNEQIKDSISSYKMAFEKIKTQEEFVNTYKQGKALREYIVKYMDEKTSTSVEELPDLFWLESAFPGFILELVAEGTTYHLFVDYKQWNQVAQKTKGKFDDEYVSLCYFAYAADSVEYFFPSWQIQTWDYGGSSLLGKGLHKGMLDRLTRLFEKNKLFAEEILAFKKDLLNDISNGNTTFWEPQDKIITELDSILGTSFIILDQQDQIVLETKRKQFDAPERHNIKVNTKSGI